MAQPANTKRIHFDLWLVPYVADYRLVSGAPQLSFEPGVFELSTSLDVVFSSGGHAADGALEFFYEPDGHCYLIKAATPEGQQFSVTPIEGGLNLLTSNDGSLWIKTDAEISWGTAPAAGGAKSLQTLSKVAGGGGGGQQGPGQGGGGMGG
jgi:hypothetical protein